MSLDDQVAAGVEEVLSRVNRTYTYRTFVDTLDVVEGTVVKTPTDTVVTGTPPIACTVDYFSTPSSVEQIQQAGLRIISTPSRLKGVSPRIHSDIVLIGSAEYRVVRCDPVYSGMKIAIYKIYLVGTNAPAA